MTVQNTELAAHTLLRIRTQLYSIHLFVGLLVFKSREQTGPRACEASTPALSCISAQLLQP